MKYVSLSDSTVRRLPFYLAMEEYVARRFDEEFFFMWQVDPTVIFGRNQLIEREVNIDYCRNNGIAVYRRKSGGGCVFADMSNIMFSYIVSSDDVVTTFSSYTERVAAMLRSLGLNAESTGRNDVLIDGRKVSGNAFYHIPGRSIVHGTMLYDTDLAHITQAISPSEAKLESKGVDSVRSHITTLSRHIDMDIEGFKDYARRYMSDGELVLTTDDISSIEEMSQPYYSDEWILGKNPLCGVSRHCRIEGVGEFQVDIELKGRRVHKINIAGDYFLLSDIDAKLLDRLKGAFYTREALADAIGDIDVGSIISGLDKSQLLNILIE